MKSIHQRCQTAAVAASFLGALTCSAATVYEAKYTGTAPQNFYGSALEYGDEITLAGSARTLTGFSFAYFSDYDLADGLTLKFYNNDGTGGAPGTSFFSYTLDIISSPSGIDVSIPFVPDPSPAGQVPDTFTFTVLFDGYGDLGTAGLLLADAPASIGFSYDDFWLDGVLNVADPIGSYYANFEASVTAVPEANAGVVATIALAGLGVMTGYRRLRRK